MPCHYLFGPHVTVVNVYVALLNLRNSHVALSILEVNGHSLRLGWDVLDVTSGGYRARAERVGWMEDDWVSLSGGRGGGGGGGPSRDSRRFGECKMD